MPVMQTLLRVLRDAQVRWRTATGIRRAVLLLGSVGMIAGAGLLTAGVALAGVGSEPGHLRFSPASGAATLRPSYSTTDGCPVGYQASAQLSEFNMNGTFASRIGVVVPGPVAAFHGVLAGNIGAVLGVTNITKGGTVEFAIGCYSQIAGTGKVRWVQSSFLTLSSDGKSYSTSAARGRSASSSASGQSASGSASGQSASGSGNGQASTSGHVDSASVANTSGMSTSAEAAWIAAACVLVAATVGITWYRRRNRSRLM